MPGGEPRRKWVFAILTAVLFPALALHGTCIAVMGPGTWGSGLHEVLPEFHPASPRAAAYGREFRAGPDPARRSPVAAPPPDMARLRGDLTWSQRVGERAVFLTDELDAGGRRQHLYASISGDMREVPVESGHALVRPQWAGERIIYERWNPWAIPPAHKLRRYVASWADPALRPEAALFGSDAGLESWSFLMPGHTLTLAPNGRIAALLRSGALLAGYYSIHVWPLDRLATRPILSLREHGSEATRSFALQWSADSGALRIHGRTAGFERRRSQLGAGPDGLAIDLVYVVAEESVYDLNLGS